MNRKSISIVLLIGLLTLVFAPVNVFASATASADAKGGEDCGDIEKRSGQNTGALEVIEVKVNGLPLEKGVDYTVENNKSTRPKIKFVNPLLNGDKVKVTLSTGKRGNWDVVLTLSDC